jgi:leader peptidase (prepilin peptidase)/N-methyltransferase
LAVIVPFPLSCPENLADNFNPKIMKINFALLFFQTEFLPLPFVYVAVGYFGAIVGSFLNVVIHRLPNDESIVFPSSHCPKCNASIKPFDNIPIISWLILRGKCRNCKATISARYPAVEALTALLYLATLWHAGWSYALPFELVFVTAIIPLVFIDAEHQILPNKITYPFMLFAIIARVVLPLLMNEPYFDDLTNGLLQKFPTQPTWVVSLIGALIGAIAGGGFLWLVGFLWEKLRGVEAMGLGDVKMMLGFGAFLGWRLTLLAIFIGVLTGSIVGIALMVKRGDKNLQSMLPFGIFLGIGSVVALLLGKLIINWYMTNFIP